MCTGQCIDRSEISEENKTYTLVSSESNREEMLGEDDDVMIMYKHRKMYNAWVRKKRHG